MFLRERIQIDILHKLRDGNSDCVSGVESLSGTLNRTQQNCET
jgi:hypothetical protein